MSTQIIDRDAMAVPSGFLISKENSGAQVVEIGKYLTIGRASDNGLELADPFVSSRHGLIEKRDHGYLLRDLKSQNGTFVNGNRIIEVFLNEGDLLRIGEREFCFQKVSHANMVNDTLKSKNEEWNKQLQSLPVFAQTDLPVLLLGASGTGKEILARAVHKYSPRTNAPFVSVNCSALSESLIESELFGHLKGSFTGAVNDRKGAFEAARGGTLFLDEIGDLPLTLQPKLLRALENREIRPVGSDRNIETNVRIIAATHKNLQTQVVRGTFRTDLFYRLHVVKMMIPPLAERMEDFETLLYGFAREMRVRFSHDAIITLKQHTWPGNIRELKNAVARASALYPKELVERDHIHRLLDLNLPPQTEMSISKKPMIREIEKEMIIHRLIVNRGNQRKTAADLGMPKSTLHDRIKTYEIDIEKLLTENLV
jgi:transcriptional regulator with GAF, ATPase, and Fis domain